MWRVAPGVSVQLEVEGGKAEKIPLRVTVTTFDYTPIKVALQDGTVLYDPATGVLPDFLGFSALEILDPSYRPSTWIVRDGLGRRMSRKSGETVRDAIGYKFRGSVEGSSPSEIHGRTRRPSAAHRSRPRAVGPPADL